MSLELAGMNPESFETELSSDSFLLSGDGRLRQFGIEFGEGWLTPHGVEESAGIDVEHESGALARVRIRSGSRLRIELSIESSSDDLLSVAGPVFFAAGEHGVLGWHAGASAEAVVPSPSGSGWFVQRRGLSRPGPRPASWYPLDAEVTLAPRQLVTATWTYEVLSGGLLDLPVEASWLPVMRYVPSQEAVVFSAPDGMVTVSDGVQIDEADGEFEVYPPLGVSTVEVWGAGGSTSVEIGSYRDLSLLRERVVDEPGSTDTWAYLAVRHLLESAARDDVLDRIDWVLGQYEEAPTAWGACAAQLATSLGLPLEAAAQRAATEVLAAGRIDDVLLLALHGLAPRSVLAGQWPVGDLNELGLAAMARLNYGRISTDQLPLKGRDIAIVRLFAAGLGESGHGLQASACAQISESRLLCQLSLRPMNEELAWLSIS